MKKKTLFIYNPKSGKGTIKGALYDIFNLFAESGFEVIVHPTRCAGDATGTIIEYADRIDQVICSGGDGTLDEVVEGVMKSKPDLPIGYIPAGSTNDFGASLGISKNLLEAAQSIVGGEVFSCDVGRFNDRHFVYIAAFGLFTDVAYETDQAKKNLLGHAAYLLEAGKRLFNVPNYEMHIRCNELELTDRFTYGMITNSKSVGGMKNLPGPDVDLTDGLFEVRLIYPPRNPLELNEIIYTLLNPKVSSKLVLSFKTRHLEIESVEPIDWTLDGEYGGEHKKVVVDNRQRALKMLVQKEVPSDNHAN
jgi:diacylglycerol kinase (ATP)